MNARKSKLPQTNRSRTAWRFCAAVTVLLSVSGWGGFTGWGEEESKAEKGTHWSYQPIERPAVPAVKATERIRTPIDAFLLSRLEKEGRPEEGVLGFSPDASREELVRRVYFDLLGLPPTPEEIEAFVNDSAEDAYERLIDRLLANPHYGERWGRIWLDAVRYADTAGFNADPLRPLAWKYRDYVIQAMNDDTPYDRFVAEQLAGDELYPEEERAWVATGFCRLMPDESNASDVLLARQEILNDATSVLGAVILGQSLGCAQCHDHKFDPLTQKDFYRMQAFFVGVVPLESAEVGNKAEREEFHHREAEWMQGHREAYRELHQLETAAYVKAYGEKRLRFPEVMWEAYETFPEDRTAFQRQMLFFSERQIRGEIKEEKMLAAMMPEEQSRFKELREEMKQLEKERPVPSRKVEAMVASEVGKMPETFVLGGGSYDKPDVEVSPGFPEVINTAFEVKEPTIEGPREGVSGRRSALVKWLFAAENPLTARVMANRIWQGHFGKGIVENANDFGTQTGLPSHPELLDWLAKEFAVPTWEGIGGEKTGWSIKRFHKLILLSTAYRQTSRGVPESPEVAAGLKADSTNRWYWRFPRRRLEAESLRDALLAVSGNLNEKMFGPPIYPPLPTSLGKPGSWPVTQDPHEQRRRSVYILAKRNMPYPLLATFDLPDMHESCARRAKTTTGLQALFLLNSETVLECAQQLAGKLLRDNDWTKPEVIVEDCYRRVLGRRATGEEVRLGLEYVSRQQDLIRERLKTEGVTLAPLGGPLVIAPEWGGAWVDYCHALLNLNEFMYVD